jgi:uncharacterized protein (TIGR02145 family)
LGTDAIYVPPFTVWLGQQSGTYSYTLTFNQPVNNIKIQYRGTDDGSLTGIPPGTPEVFTWTTNGGTPSISLCKGCYQTINGNVVLGSDPNSGTPGEIGGGLITIMAPSSYTTLTLSGTGRNLGTLFSICSSSIVPAPAPSPSPTPSPSRVCNTICSLPDVTIGTQTWKGCNLDVTTYRNGDPIPQVQDPVAFAALTTGAWCYYNNDFDNGCAYGKLYNGYAVIDPRGLSPEGYHIPTDSDFYTLMTYLSPGGTGAVNTAGGKLKEAGFNHWFPNNLGATNSSGWTGLPGGGNEDGAFTGLGLHGAFWTTTPYFPTNVTDALYYWELYNWNTLTISELFEQKGYYKRNGHSIRLIKDNTSTLGCVYYYSMGYLYAYNPSTNVSSAPILPSNEGSVFAQSDTHTANKYFKTNNTNLIQEWNTTAVPNTLVFSRNISVNTGYIYFYYAFAVNNTTLLTIITNATTGTNTNPINAILARIDITNNTVTPAQVTPLFNIITTSLGFGTILLTSTNKLLFIGTRFSSNNLVVTYLRQYSYPDGALELEIDLAPFVPNSNSQNNYCRLFEYGGNIFFTVYGQITNFTSTNIYQINLNSPYTITLVRSLPGLIQGWNSSLNCNTVNLVVQPIPSPSPTPSTSPPSNTFRTIYKYLDIQ